MNLNNKIAELQAGAKRAKKLIKLQLKFPDLELHTDRWNTERLTSKLVNEMANKCEIKHSCGCCTDSVLQAHAYIEIDGEKIYSNASVNVGEKHWISGDQAYDTWREDLLKVGYNENVIQLVENYLNANRPQKLVDDDEPV